MELTEFKEKVVEHTLQTSASSKHAARSSLRHLERAWKLAAEMPELAIFSAITAEEESATALFHALKKHNYKGSSLLNIKSHLHKTALHPFFLAIWKILEDFKNIYDPKLEFNSDLSPNGTELLRLRFSVPDPINKWAYPLPPLEFTISINGSIHKFEPELSQLATEKNSSSALKYVRKLSNRRNQVLYASAKGIPHALENIEPFLIYRRSVVFSHLMVLLLIDPYPQQQIFVQQALNAFLDMLQIMPDEQ
jgi:hypothetical protein